MKFYKTIIFKEINEENRPMVRPARNQRRIQFNPTAP